MTNEALTVAVAILLAVPSMAALLIASRRNGNSESYSSMRETIAFLSKRIDEMERAKDKLREQVDYLNAYVRILVTAMREADVIIPPPPPENRPPILVLPDDGIFELSVRIRQYFDNEEMTMLALELGINLEDIAGDSHAAKALKLAQAADRRVMLPELVVAEKEARPRAQWD